MKPMNALKWFLCISLWILAFSLSAQIIYVDINASGTDNGTSWADAYNDLQDALANAVSGDEIWVATGIYTPTSGSDRTISFQLKNGVALYGGFSGLETLRSQRDWFTNVTILSGDLAGDDGPDFANNDENSYHVVVGSGTNATAVLDGFTISGGNANGSGSNNSGAGMFNVAGSPSITNCSFSGNSASIGGGMSNVQSSPTLTNCSLSGNSATLGGGMYNDNNSSPTLTNCNFSGNSATLGGGMYNFNNSSPTLTNCSLSGNLANSIGGGMVNFSSSPTLTNCSFSGNSVTNNGGGMYNDNNSSPTLTNCNFSGNSATNNGGGMYNYFNSSPTLTNCSFSGNSANSTGGGMYNAISSSPTLTNCSFSGNSASIFGGGMYNQSSSSPTLTNCILWNNRADGNTTTSSASIFNSSSTPNISYSLIANSGGSSNWDNTIGTNNGNNIDADPLFIADVNPATAPTSAGNLRLQFGSPAIDAGLNSANSSLFDLDGNPRILSGIIDMGAHEFFPFGTDDISITDPCSCDDPLNIGPWGGLVTLFHDVLVVNTGIAGQNVVLETGHPNFQDIDGNQVTDGVVFTETSPGVYEYSFYRPPGTAFSVTVSVNGVPADFDSENCLEAADCPLLPIPTMSEWGLILLALLMLQGIWLSLVFQVKNPLIEVPLLWTQGLWNAFQNRHLILGAAALSCCAISIFYVSGYFQSADLAGIPLSVLLLLPSVYWYRMQTIKLDSSCY